MAVTTKTRVIDLAELRGDDDFPAYVSVYSGAQKDPFVLSPAVMEMVGTEQTNRYALAGVGYSCGNCIGVLATQAPNHHEVIVSLRIRGSNSP